MFAALAVAGHLQNTTGISIKKIIQTLRTQRSATIEISGQRITSVPTSPTPPATSSSDSNQVTKANDTTQVWRSISALRRRSASSTSSGLRDRCGPSGSGWAHA